MAQTDFEKRKEAHRKVFQFLEILAVHAEPRSSRVHFRGQADAKWPLLPKAGREDVIKDSRQGLGVFKTWNEQADAHEDLPDNEWERLAIAQHHGLATRLLDWSYNPLIALYFAAASEHGRDGSLFIYSTDWLVDQKTAPIDANWGDVAPIYVPRPIHGRILNQAGAFSYHADPSLPLNDLLNRNPSGHPNSALSSLTVNAALKPAILTVLNTFGINEAFIYPGLDGYSRHINWLRRANKSQY